MSNIMRYKEYYAKINYEDETSTFYGKIEDIDDLISFESDTVEGLRREFQMVINEYIEDCKESGKEPNKPYRGSFNVRIEPELHKKATIFSKTFGMSLNQFVEMAIREKVDQCQG